MPKFITAGQLIDELEAYDDGMPVLILFAHQFTNTIGKISEEYSEDLEENVVVIESFTYDDIL